MENIWNREEAPGVTVRCVAEAIGIHFGLEDSDRVLDPLHPDVLLAYDAHSV